MIQNCATPHYLGCTVDSTGATASVYRFLNGKYLKAELNGKRFPSSDEAFHAMDEHGYGTKYYPRSSVVLPLFAKLKHCRETAKFDALYRYWKHLVKHGNASANRIQSKVARLAKRVGCFHRATVQFRPDYYKLVYPQFVGKRGAPK